MRLTSDHGSDSATVISPQAFADRLDFLLAGERPGRIAVACSGGPDSMALAWLAAGWARANGVALQVLIVDHALRPESAAEAAATALRLTARAVQARVLTRLGPPLGRNIQAQARQARYALLAEACAAADIHHLLLAHHRDDQAETFLLRLARGSGVEGLAAMADRLDPPQGPALLRPLLPFPKSALAATLAEAGLEAADDPSNRNPAHARVRMRGLMPILAAEGMTAERLSNTARRMAEAAEVLDHAARDLADRCLIFREAGYATIDASILSQGPRAIRLRLLARLLQAIGGGDYPPRLHALERLDRDILARQGTPPRPRTLAGCRLQGLRDSRLLLTREAVAAEASLRPVRPCLVWDGRFRLDIDVEACPPDARLAALGRDGMRRLRLAGRADRPDDPPAPARAGLPTLLDSRGHILEVPHLGYRAAIAQPAIRAISPVFPQGFRFASFSSGTRQPT